MNFDQFSLDPRVLAGVKEVGFTVPTPIQEEAIPVVLKGGDVLGLAQTGTGKTAAFALPILNRLSTGPLRKTRALIVAPTRELAEQIREAFDDFGQKTQIRTVSIYGGVGKGAQVDALKKKTEIVVACPGRLLDLHREGRVDFSDVEVLVLDEADRMCDMGFLPDIKRILKLLPKERQTLFFSATMPPDIRKLSDEILKNPTTVQIGLIAPAETVSHAIYPIAHKQKKNLLVSLLQNTATGRVLIFTRTKYRARNLARDLEKEGFRAAALQGNMSQNKRQKAINGFRSGRYDILAATDIAARGIDVTEISHVINFDMPDTVDAYTHRIGRTGRAEQEGEAFTFAVHDDQPMVYAIEKALGARLERRRFSSFDYGEFDPESLFTSRSSAASQGQPRHNGGSGRSGQSRSYSQSNGGSDGNRNSGGSNGNRSNGGNRRQPQQRQASARNQGGQQ